MAFIFGIAVLVFFVWVIGSFIQWVRNTTKGVGARFAVDSKRSIVQRNEDIIRRYLATINDEYKSHYTENKVRECIREIADREGRPSIAPKHREWLNAWERRTDIPAEYLELNRQLKLIFESRRAEKREDTRRQAAEAARIENERVEAAKCAFEEQRVRQGNTLYEENADLIKKFLEITERKVSILDDYGDENWGTLNKELDACIGKIAHRNGAPINWQEHYADVRRGGAGVILPSYSWLRNRLEELFREYHEHQKRLPSSLIDVNGLGGVAFEVWVAKRLKELGFEDVRGTPTTGDQGADLIAKRNGRTIIIQAKRYQGAVGNKAVQEVASAVSFYGGDEGWVITNSTFTPSARALAQKTNVHLFAGRDLDRLSEILRG